tara:strand:- start:473 stop:766 length:294 start_codon:yes stop_codon:yes gene_type:complete
MNAKEVQAKMERNVEIRKLIAKLDREISGLQTTLNELYTAVHDENTNKCTIELSEKEMDCCGSRETIVVYEDPDGFHGKSYSDYLKGVEERSYEKDE